jgi:hypothetical protein
MIIAMKEILTTLAAVVVLSPAIADAKANSCPSQNFPTFLKAYQNNVDVQKKFTHYPLKSNSYYPDFAEKPTTSFLKKSWIHFPTLMNEQAMKDQSVELSIEKKAARWYQVITRNTGGTGADAFEYDFKKSNGCWQLVEVTDSST